MRWPSTFGRLVAPLRRRAGSPAPRCPTRRRWPVSARARGRPSLFATRDGLARALARDRRPVRARLAAELSGLGVEPAAPLVVHEGFVGLIILGGKPTDEPFTTEERETRASDGAAHRRRHLQPPSAARGRAPRRGEPRASTTTCGGASHCDTVRAFAAAIDFKDKYTQGHSERVGHYCRPIARELGWDDGRVEAIAVGGYFSDLGKLVVGSDIINAPYGIDAKQSAELNRHPGRRLRKSSAPIPTSTPTSR